MKLKSLNKYISYLTFFLLVLPLYAEEEIDIWNKEKKQKSEIIEIEKDNSNSTLNSETIKASQINNNIQIENEILENSKDTNLFGIYDPADNDFDLNMWSKTKAEDVRLSIKRILEIK